MTVATPAHEDIKDRAEFDFVALAWAAKAAALIDLKAAEMELRKKLFKFAFPTPKENTNTFELGGGWSMKAVHKINRKIDEAALPAITAKLKEMGVSTDALVKWNPELQTANYRLLAENTRLVFEEALIVTEGSPSLELVPPKTPKGKKQ